MLEHHPLLRASCGSSDDGSFENEKPLFFRFSDRILGEISIRENGDDNDRGRISLLGEGICVDCRSNSLPHNAKEPLVHE